MEESFLSYVQCCTRIWNNMVSIYIYRLLHKILGTNKTFKKIVNFTVWHGQDLQNWIWITDASICKWCSSQKSMEWFGRLDILKNGYLDIVLGYLNTDNCSLTLNMIIILTKHYIFTCARTNHTPIVGLKGLLKREYKDQIYRHTEWEQCEKSFSCFAPFDKLFNE